jgi:sugar phosphate isomerase/epimerase
MQFGVCGGPEIAAPAAKAGFDYFEWSVGGFLKPLEDDSAFQMALAQVKSAPLPCEAVNVFVPAKLKITGPEVDFPGLQAYSSIAFQRAEEAGVKVIVFGSGGARNIPEGFPQAAAWDQLVDFCGMLGPLAENHGVIIAIEPLNRNECNVVNSVGEALALARHVQNPAIRVLVDSYHWSIENETSQNIINAGPLLAHAHIATQTNRRAPGIEPQDFQLFFEALHQAGYSQRISIEAQIDKPLNELPIAHDFLKRMVFG